MDEIKPPTPEELATEQEALKDIDEAELRTQVVADLGLDETDDAEVIDKAVKREVAQRKITQSAIKAKIKHRTDAEEARKNPKPQEPAAPKPEDETGKPPALTQDDVKKAAKDAARELLDEQFLDEQDLPDEIKAEVRRIAEISKKPFREALKDPYIASKVKEHEADNASAGNTHRSGKPKRFDPNTPPDVDMQTPEGQKAYDEWYEKVKAAGG